MAYKILAINPGSTSTKISLANDDQPVFVADIAHSQEELRIFKRISDQFHFRKQVVIEELKKRNVPLDFDAVIGRGGLAKPVPSGVFTITEKMIIDQQQAIHQHVCDLGCMIADEIARDIPGCRSFIADPGVVDEMEPEARVSGSPLMPRMCIWHALNQKAIGRRFAKDMGTTYEKLNLIICHLGGGISIAAHDHGRAIDANNALDGEGPFSPERAGTLPAADLIHLCFSGKYTEDQLLKKVSGQAGLIAHLGTNDLKEIMNWIKAGDKHAEVVVSAMIWHIAKNIAAEGAVLYGKVDAILLTGGMAKCDYIIERLKRRLNYLAPIHVYPGQDEMKALTENALAVLRGERAARDY
ncbi:butyrate kinase [Prevotella denticola CRIS 18C-A]|jgi:butyrate kinase|uniref:Probable butyrate kinase n=1 Tax=Prevotella denticola CRIS 18C-A TaxID=944557 RepID=F0H5P6_9BACT|nr:butyrate kinase [Prevotella denticola]AEA20328.1 butyrate kinase [Prevotella denticola F0289]AXV48316.1 butyrate kinase [Prevotella denticola]EGC86883.1 butyrate kinase [Prevotella denticola CRIS 18C-A]KGF38725.1 butyrate kinase [Prevotella denticola DNF00960]QUB88676.1 butyrate kinase [Prevotella denticola]